MSSSRNNGNQVYQTTLKGHKDSILCLAHNSDLGQSLATTSSSCLLSGSEDGTARLWDLRSSSRAALCIVSPRSNGSQDVNSVAFSPPPDGSNVSNTGERSSFARDYLVFVSVANLVYGYDLRNASSPIVRDFNYDVSSILENTEEVNQISLSPTRNQEAPHLAAADDGGTVHVTSEWSLAPTQQRRRRILHHDPDGLAVVTCAEFRHNTASTKGVDLASGGTDCTIHLWDVTRPRRPSSTIEIRQDNAGANQVCNPPMVHSLSWSPSGRLLAAGLGDGTCSIIGVNSRILREVERLGEGHDAAVVSVIFPEFVPSESHHVASHDRLLASAGNDGAILLWDLGSEIAGEGAVDPASVFGEDMNQSLETGMEGLSLSDDPRILFGIPHGEKPNWLATSRCYGPPALFVADTTNNITAYTLPTR